MGGEDAHQNTHSTVDNKEGIRNLTWNNKMTVNTGQRADKTERDHAAEASLSACDSVRIPVDTQISRELGNWGTTLIDYYVSRWERPKITQHVKRQ